MSETMTAEERVRALIDLTEALNDLVARENDILATRRPRDLQPLQAEKARLAGAYAGAIRDIARDRSAVAGAAGPLVEKLRALTKTFEGCALRQQALLAGATKAGEGLVRAVAEEAGRASRSSAPVVLDERA